MSDVKRCAACGKENPVSEMEVCMHHQMHRYVCDSKCMTDFYNPPKKPTAAEMEAKVAALEAELATVKKVAYGNMELLEENAKLRAELERRVPLYEAVERACGELPNGWTIELHMENGAGWVELYDDSGCQVDDFPTDNERLDYTINDAIDATIAAARQEGGK